ncbi:RasGAP protein [Blastocladiella emersonii ATCC 22665]|nr:RasGAP protein [Blastocladiella emersonii ATCC 22665]
MSSYSSTHLGMVDGGGGGSGSPYNMGGMASALPDPRGPSSTVPRKSGRRAPPPDHKRVSYAHVLAARAEQEVAVDDELAQAQKRLKELKQLISVQSKKNFTLERDVRYLDGRIALLIQNRMQLDDKEARDIAHVMEDADESGARKQQQQVTKFDERRTSLYGNLFYILQTETRYIATLCRRVTLDQMDSLLQTVMFTLYGNQYDSREEYLLLSMFQTVLSHQFDQATDFGSLLRANTPVSRMMTTYTRRGPGQTYLKTLLSERMASLIKHKDLNLEINPVKVYQQILESTGDTDPARSAVTMDEAAAIPEVQALVVPRVRMLLEIATSFLNTIIDSIDSVPYGIRWICKQIKGLAKRKYPEASDWDLCSLIGGFFMLRFVNPAIVTPQAFMLVPSQPSAHPRRTLTLVAKMLQNLANKPSAVKESYMAPLNSWGEQNKDRIQRFLLALTDVSDFYESLELDQYLALSKRDLHITITTNEVFATHALLLKHREFVCQPGSHLDTLLHELGTAAPAQVPRPLNTSHSLPLISRWETEIADSDQLIKTQTDTSPNEALFLDAKSEFVHLLRRVPALVPRTGPLELDRVAELALATAATHDAAVAHMAQRALDMLGDLERAGVVRRRDGYRILAEEVAAELAHLGTLRQKVLAEAGSLETVYRTICEHNEYLISQLDTYKAYLANVRMKTAGAAVASSSGGRKSPFGKSSSSSSGGGSSRSIAAAAEPMPPLGGSSTSQGSSGGFLGALAGAVANATRSGGSSNGGGHVVVSKSFSHAQLERDGVITESNVPEQRKPNITVGVQCPSPGSFLVSLDYKGRDRPILEMDLRLDDLLEKQHDGIMALDLEYIQLSVPRLIQLLNKQFLKR